MAAFSRILQGDMKLPNSPPLRLLCCGLFAVGFGILSRACAQSTQLLVDVDHRSAMSLDGPWHTIIDPYGNGLYNSDGSILPHGYGENRQPTSKSDLVEYSFAKSPTLQVPGDWNTQRKELLLYEGVMWYEKDFVYQPKPQTRTFLHIGAANYRAYVFVNGTKICQHEGGFMPFDCEVTKVLHPGNNFVVIAVDSTRLKDGVPTLKTDWWNYGGLTRDVSLIDVPDKFIDDYDLHLRRGSTDEITGYVHVEGAGAGQPVTVRIPEANITEKRATDAAGRAAFAIHAAGLQLWSPDHPRLYRITLRAGSGANADRLNDDIGFRTIEVRGTEILLNGNPIFLRGISIHGEAPIRGGRAVNDQDDQTLLRWAKEMGANFVRLPHYPQGARMLRQADRMGLLAWEEVPVYWAIEFDNPAVLAKAQQQLSEMIRRDRNKASVIFWSVANETPVNDARNKFLEAMIASARAQDGTRLITAAMLSSMHGNNIQVSDPLGAFLDVVSFNEYAGWYRGSVQEVGNIEISSIYEKPLLLSEFGGGAKAGFHSDAQTRFSEEFQANLYEQQLAMLRRVKHLRGMCPWILVDFRSPMRVLPEIQDFYNRKGLISDQGQKKAAYFIMQKAYTERTVGKAR